MNNSPRKKKKDKKDNKKNPNKVVNREKTVEANLKVALQIIALLLYRRRQIQKKCQAKKKNKL